MSKEQFFTQEYIPLLKKLNGTEKGSWGVLSPQGMVEHMTDSIGIAWGRIRQPLHTSADMLQRFRDFALSDKEFKPGTKNAYMDEAAPPLRKANIAEAVAELEQEIAAFVKYYHQHPDAVILNPFFGDFNYNEWLHLLHKHAVHHLKQFKLM
ncbi:MAG: DinB family protein [Bacteroidia bacterium]